MKARLLLALWFLTDLLLFVGSFALAYFVRVGWIFSNDFPFRPYLAAVVLAAPLWLLVLISLRAFRLTRSQQAPENLLLLLYANIVGCALFALAYFFLYDLFFSRLLLIEAFLIATIVLRLWHLLYERFLRTMLWHTPPAFPTLVVGVTRESRRLVALLAETKNPLRPVAILDAHGAKEKEIEGIPVLGKLDKLEETLREHRISHLIHCSNLEQSLNLLSACRTHGITYLLLPSVLGIIDRDERTESVEGWPVMMVSARRRGWLF
jgi:FlaA1/EpsC-like NDP-sugar epimerase